MIWQDTPIYIISFNRVHALRQLVGWLRRAGMTRVTIIDNHSTYQPPLEYYETLENVQIIILPQNEGHDVFWRRNYHLQQDARFIVTDPDVVPDLHCPLDLVLKMHQVADRIPCSKVGPGIRIDNLPDHYHLKDLMLCSERRYWDELKRTPQGDGFFAQIDTTFALYERGAGKWDGVHVRLDFPYVVEHLPWYQDSSQPNEERDFYKATVLPGISHSQ